MDHFLLFMFRVCHACLSVKCSLVVTCWGRAILLALLFVVFCCVLSLSHVFYWVGWYLIVLTPDLCILTYFCLVYLDKTSSWTVK